MKKTIAGLLAMCMMASVFTGCSANEQNKIVNNDPTVNGTAVEATTSVDEDGIANALKYFGIVGNPS